LQETLRFGSASATPSPGPNLAAQGELAAPDKHTVEFDFKYDGLGVGTLAFNNMSGLGRNGTGTLKVDGKAVASQEMEWW
jgi:hypothetical protein